jgi:hypothetical protein
LARRPQESWRLWCPPKSWPWKDSPILLPRFLVERDGSGPEPKRARRPKSGVAGSRRVVWPKCNVPKKPYREGMSRVDFLRRCRRSRNDSGGGLVASTKGGVSLGRTMVECRGGKSAGRRRDGRDEDVDAATQNRAKSKTEQPETELRDAHTRVHRANVPLEQTRAKSVGFRWT